MLLKPKKSEEALIAGARLGNQMSYMELYDRYSAMVYKTTLQFLKHSGEAEDAAQESFIKAFDRLDSYRGESSFGSWIKRIAIHHCLDRLKVDRVAMEEIDDNWREDSSDDNWDESLYELVISRIGQLPDGYRVVLSLYLLEGYDHEEISDILGISSSASRSQYTRAKSKLRSLIKNEIDVTG